MQNLSTINRIEHIEPEEPVGSIIYSQDSIFVAFVRVFHDEDTVPNEAHIEQQVQAVYLYRRSKAPAEPAQRACNRSDEPAIGHGHAMGSKPGKKLPHSPIYSSLSEDG